MINIYLGDFVVIISKKNHEKMRLSIVGASDSCLALFGLGFGTNIFARTLDTIDEDD